MPDQAQDVANRVRKLSKGVLPPGGAGGRVLRKASDADYDVAWQPDDGGLPPGGVAGDVVTKLSYVDGDAEWAAPPSAGSGFPVGPYDDTNATHEIQTVAVSGVISELIAASQLDAHVGTTFGQLLIVTGTSGGSEATGVGIESQVDAGAQAKVTTAAQESGAQGAEVELRVANDSGANGFITIALQNGGGNDTAIEMGAPVIFMAQLPTSDPGTPGQLWNNSGVVSVSL